MRTESVSSQLKKLRAKKGYTLREVAAKLNIPFGTYSGYERYENRRIPANVLQGIANLFETTTEFLESGAVDFHATNPLIIHVDSYTKQDRIAYVPFAAQAGYVKHYNEVSYLSHLATYSLPNFINGTYRMFPVEGDSMIPTYQSGDILICQYVEQCKHIKDGECYVIVSTEGICVKRCINAIQKRGAIIIESDNNDYKPDVIPVEAIREVWQPKARITKN